MWRLVPWLLLACSVRGGGVGRDQVRPEIALAIEQLDSDDAQVFAMALDRLKLARESALPALPKLRRMLKSETEYSVIEVVYAVCGMGPKAISAMPDLIDLARTYRDTIGSQVMSTCGSTDRGFGASAVRRWLAAIPAGGKDPDGLEFLVTDALYSCGEECSAEIVKALRAEKGVRLRALSRAVRTSSPQNPGILEALVGARRSKRLSNHDFIVAVELSRPASPAAVAEMRRICGETPKNGSPLDSALRQEVDWALRGRAPHDSPGMVGWESQGCDDRLRVRQARKPVFVQTLVAQAAVERLDIRVLVWLPGSINRSVTPRSYAQSIKARPQNSLPLSVRRTEPPRESRRLHILPRWTPKTGH